MDSKKTNPGPGTRGRSRARGERRATPRRDAGREGAGVRGPGARGRAAAAAGEGRERGARSRGAARRGRGARREAEVAMAPSHTNRFWSVVLCSAATLLLAFVGLSRGVLDPLMAAPVADAAPVEAAGGSYDEFAPVKLLEVAGSPQSAQGRLTASFWGDVIATDYLLSDCSGEDPQDELAYDFQGIFRRVAPWNDEQCDVSFVNMETTMGGTQGGFGVTGYPSFNTPETMADALVQAGFDVVATNSNHTYDTWVDSIVHSQQVWARHGSVLTVGSYESAQDRETPRVVACNGVRVAFLSYSYGQNGYEQSDLPNDFYAVPWDEAAMEADVARARAVSDAVVVYLHMGTEYQNEASDEQRQAAQACADAGASLVVGSHAHVIQPAERLSSADGREVWAVYGLGDAVSGYPGNAPCIYSGVFTCAFVRGDDGSVSVQEPAWHPLVEHREEHGGEVSHSLYFVSDYSEALAEKNDLLAGLDDPWGWVRGEAERVLGRVMTIAL